MTVKNWRAPEHVGRDLGLSGDDLDRFLKTVRTVHREKAQTVGRNYDLSREFFTYLNNEVFSDSRVVTQLQELGIAERDISSFEAGNVDIKETYEVNSKFYFKLDEIVDFIMAIKLVNDYLQTTDREWLKPRDSFHYLIYLVNYELRESEVLSSRKQRTNLGMLEFTGYRYTFRKREHGPHSVQLERDKDRLFAWDILNQEVNEDYNPNEYEPFQIQLGHSGELLTMRYKTKFDNIRNLGSNLLREWAISQQDVLDRFGGSSAGELREHVTSINEFQDIRDGRVILTGRPRFFDPDEDGPVSSISEGMQLA